MDDGRTLCSVVRLEESSLWVFSIASRVLSIKRNRMDPAMAGEVYYVHSNWDWFSSQVSWEEAIAAKSNDDASNQQAEPAAYP
jgi:hypothetical protein